MTQPTGLLGGLLPQLGQAGSGNDPLRQLLARLFPNSPFGQQPSPTPAPTPSPTPTPQPAPNPSAMTAVQQQLMRAYPPQQAGLLAGSWRPGMPPPGQPPAQPSAAQPQQQGQSGGLLGWLSQLGQ